MALTPISDEEITVSSTSIGITGSTITPKVLMARIQHVSGGKLWEKSAGDPVAGGGDGAFDFAQFDELEVAGQRSLNAIRFIKQTGESDGVVSVQLFGEG